MVRCALDVVIGSKRQLFVVGFSAEMIDALLKHTATAWERSEICEKQRPKYAVNER